MGGFEIIEHTADVGIKAWGDTAEECLEEATYGLLDIVGIWSPGLGGQETSLTAEARDRPGVLAEWLSEVLYAYEAQDAVVRSVVVRTAGETSATGSLWLAPRGQDAAEGTQVKAITYHGLRMHHLGPGWHAVVYVDV